MLILAITFWQKLEHWDQQVFIKLNGEWTNPFLDSVMPYMRSSVYWAPLYLFVLVFVLLNYQKRGLWWILLFLSTVALTDMTGTNAFKQIIQRLRPCNDPDFPVPVRLLLKQCASGYSFISNHAANHFGMAMFIFITFRHVLKKWAWIAMLWAALISYAQVYVGVHYPLDVLAGALTGLGWGYLIGSSFNKRFGFTNFGNQPVV